jgi:hypothetical protein
MQNETSLRRGTTRRATVLVLLMLTATSGLSWSSESQAQSGAMSLRAFEGKWTGTGTLSRQNGTVERIRCQADYVSNSARDLRQTLSCRSDSTNFDLVSNVMDDGGKLTGDWTETNRNARGNLVGKLTSNNISANVQGPGFTAGIGIAVKSNKQSVDIRAQGGDIVGLNMALTKAR